MLRLESQKLQLRQQAQPMTTADMERVESEISRVRDLTPLTPTATDCLVKRVACDPSPLTRFTTTVLREDVSFLFFDKNVKMIVSGNLLYSM